MREVRYRAAKRELNPRLTSFDEQVEQYQFAASASSEIVRRSFGNVAKHSGAEWRALSVNAQTTVALENLADDILVGMVDLFRIAVFSWSKSDQAAAEILFLENICMAQFVAQGF